MKTLELTDLSAGMSVVGAGAGGGGLIGIGVVGVVISDRNQELAISLSARHRVRNRRLVVAHHRPCRVMKASLSSPCFSPFFIVFSPWLFRFMEITTKIMTALMDELVSSPLSIHLLV